MREHRAIFRCRGNSVHDVLTPAIEAGVPITLTGSKITFVLERGIACIKTTLGSLDSTSSIYAFRLTRVHPVHAIADLATGPCTGFVIDDTDTEGTKTQQTANSGRQSTGRRIDDSLRSSALSTAHGIFVELRATRSSLTQQRQTLLFAVLLNYLVRGESTKIALDLTHAVSTAIVTHACGDGVEIRDSSSWADCGQCVLLLNAGICYGLLLARKDGVVQDRADTGSSRYSGSLIQKLLEIRHGSES